jgi:hypothetical protein
MMSVQPCNSLSRLRIAASKVSSLILMADIRCVLVGPVVWRHGEADVKGLGMGVC